MGVMNQSILMNLAKDTALFARNIMDLSEFDRSGIGESLFVSMT